MMSSMLISTRSADGGLRRSGASDANQQDLGVYGVCGFAGFAGLRDLQSEELLWLLFKIPGTLP